MLLYSFALSLALALSSPVWGWRMLRQGRYRAGLRERLGFVPPRVVRWVAGRPVVWVHAVSVGETAAAQRLVAELTNTLPGHAVVLSTTTPTGQAVAREQWGAQRVFYYPLDFAFAVRNYLRMLRPSLVVLLESELWPRMLHECARAGVPVAVVNARVSDRSLPRYRALRVVWRPLLAKLSLLLAQSDADAARWRAVGAPDGRVQTTGNLKYDVQTPAETPLAALLRGHLAADVPVLVCGSTHEGEEAILFDLWRNGLRANAILLLAPRHPERAAAVEQLVAARGLHCARLSAWRLAPAHLQPESILLVDTVGELAALYSLARAAFLGGSLVAKGGQNPLEAAQFGVPVAMGTHFENFRSVVEGMLQVHAIQIVDATNIAATLAAMLHPADEAASTMGARGRAFVQAHTGATGRSVRALVALLRSESVV